ncbi:hypothetical protein VP434O481_P0027 [Vibrio phage 434O48-1]|nr:hypothetical protein VP434O481_P0027 [Vibrio phage 434O48-1]
MKSPLIYTNDIEKIIREAVGASDYELQKCRVKDGFALAAYKLQAKLSEELRGGGVVVGSVVTLPTVSPSMTVVNIDGESAELCWFADSSINFAIVNKKSLVLLEVEQEKKG